MNRDDYLRTVKEWRGLRKKKFAEIAAGSGLIQDEAIEIDQMMDVCMKKMRKYEEQDYRERTREQIDHLRSGAFDLLDVDLLIEELEEVGNSDLNAFESSVIRIVEHLLKLEYSPAGDPRRGWRQTVVNQRINAERRMDRSPSVVRDADFAKLYTYAVRLASSALRLNGEAGFAQFPTECPYAPDQILDHDFWPKNRQGLFDA